MGKKHLSLTALLLAVILLLSACANEKPPQMTSSASPLSVTAAVVGPQTTLDPAMTIAHGSETILYHLYENLMTWADDGAGHAVLVPGQAESYTLETDYAGNATYTFTLREGLTWSDGEPLVAQDFVNAWRRLADPATASPHGYLLRCIAGYDQVQATGNPAMLQVGAHDERTLVMHLTGSCAYFLEEVCAGPFTMPLRCTVTEVEVPAAEGGEEDGEEAPPARTASLLEPVGDMTTGEGVPTNGPYALSSFVQGLSGKYGLDVPDATVPQEEGSRIVMEKSSTYWNAAAIGPQTITLIPSDSDRAADYAKFQAGELDLLWELPQEATDALAQDPEWLPDPVTSVYSVVMNTQAQPFDDLNVRLAFRLAVNNKVITETAGSVAAQPAFGIVPYGVSDYGYQAEEDGTEAAAQASAEEPDRQVRDFRDHGADKVTLPENADYASDCQWARDLLAQAGYPGGKGFPEIDFIYPASPHGQRMASALQTMWKEQLGVTVNIRGLEPEEYTAALYPPETDDGEDAPPSFVMAGQYLTATYNDAASLLNLWHSKSPQNLANYISPAYDILIEAAEASVSPSARDAYLHDAEAILLNDTPVIPLYYPGVTYAMSDSLQGMFRRPNGVFFLYHVTAAPAAE